MVDDKNFLGVATFSDSGSSGRGTGKDQKQKTDWYETVDKMLDLGSDTAVTLESVGISEGNAFKKFSKGTDYEVATIDGVKVVHKRNEDRIIYLGKEYKRWQSRMWLAVEN